jgi:hypothetical protein
MTSAAPFPKDIRVIQIDAPAVTPREYARRTGLSESAVRAQISRGELPILKPTGKKYGTVLVNMMKLAEQALAVEF